MKATELERPALIRALAHPLRAQILGILQERRASPSELADELGAPLGNVSYHVGQLTKLKLIKLVKKTPRRGAIEHHYEATSAAQIRDPVWDRAPAIVKDAMIAAALDEVGRTVSDGAAIGGFEHKDSHLSRTRLRLDAQGWAELAEALVELVERADRIGADSEKRLRKANHEGERRAALVMMLFESALSFEGSVPSGKAEKRPAKGSRRARAKS